MTDDERQAPLAAIQSESQDPPVDQVAELVPFVEALTDEEFEELLHKVSETQTNRGLQVGQEESVRLASPEEIIAIVEAIKKPSDRFTP